MPKLFIKIESRGNGIRSNLVNLEDIAKHLNVPVEYPLKYLGHELGTNTKTTGKGNDIQHVIMGSFNDDELAKLLDKFIDKYICCHKCKYPEMTISVKKKEENIYGRCAACGAKSTLDSRHRVASYILKNPPSGKDTIGETKKTKEKSDKPSKGKNDLDSDDMNEKNEDDDEDETNITTMPRDKRIKVLLSEAKTLRKTFLEQITKGETSEYTIGIATMLKGYIDYTPDDLAFVVFNTIFDSNLVKEVELNGKGMIQLFNALNISDPQAKILLNLQYYLIEKNPDTFTKFIPTILKAFYDLDFLTEEFLSEWNEKVRSKHFVIRQSFLFDSNSNKNLHKHAQPFLDWLKTADEEEEEEGEIEIGK